MAYWDNCHFVIHTWKDYLLITYGGSNNNKQNYGFRYRWNNTFGIYVLVIQLEMFHSVSFRKRGRRRSYVIQYDYSDAAIFYGSNTGFLILWEEHKISVWKQNFRKKMFWSKKAEISAPAFPRDTTLKYQYPAARQLLISVNQYVCGDWTGSTS